MKNIKFDKKMIVFRKEKHVKSIVCIMKTMFLQVFDKKNENMQKGMSKVNCLDPFSDTGPSRVDLFCFGGRFGAMPKKHVFSIVQKINLNRTKMPQGAARMPKSDY